MARKKAVGIDLGTTYSAMAYVDEAGHSQLLHNEEGELVTPSVVLFEDDATIVGKEAKKVAVLKNDRVATCVKRDMGKPVYSKPIKGRYLPPEVIQSYILRKLKDDITKKIGPDFAAIITVPAYFDEPRRKATYDAGVMSGLTVLDIVNEPTAAALAFGEDLGYLTRFGAPRERMNVMVYDLGGGTFDVTLIDMQAGDLRTICTDGDVQLGGHDWDMRLVDYCAERFRADHNEDPRQSPESFQRMLIDVEECKHSLSARQHAKLKVSHNGKSSTIDITREAFEQRTADLLERTRFTARNLVTTAHLEWSQLGRILLTGGSTRMPMVPKMLKDLSGIEPDLTVNPDEAVARGAAIYANYLLASKGETGHEPTFDVTNVNAHSLGVEGIDPMTFRKRNTILIPRNSTLPAKKTERCITRNENQSTVVVQVLEGESTQPEECSPIGRTVIRNLPPNLPQGWPVDVTYEYGVNGRLSVNAVVKGTDREVKLELERDQNMSGDRVTAWRRVVASGGGLDAFDLAIQEEIEQLQHHAPQPAGSGVNPYGATQIISAGASGVIAGGATHPPGMHPPGMHPPGMMPPGMAGSGQPPGQQAGASNPLMMPSTAQYGSSNPNYSQQPSGGANPPAHPQPGQSGIHSQPGQSGVNLQAGQSGIQPGQSGIHSHQPPGSGNPPQPTGSHMATVSTPSGGQQPNQPPGPPNQQQGSPDQAPKKRKKKGDSTTDLLLYIILTMLGVMLGYYVLVAFMPSANFLKLNLPGLPPVAASQPSEAQPTDAEIQEANEGFFPTESSEPE